MWTIENFVEVGPSREHYYRRERQRPSAQAPRPRALLYAALLGREKVVDETTNNTRPCSCAS